MKMAAFFAILVVVVAGCSERPSTGGLPDGVQPNTPPEHVVPVEAPGSEHKKEVGP